MYRAFFKRFIDIIVSAVALIVFLPVMLLLMAIFWYLNNGPVFFRQERPGKDCRIFTVLKFKTMNDAKDKNGKLLPDSVRLTRFGKFVRSTSLDEIPQLINVIRGDMSLIGPRPLLVSYLKLYNAEQMKRHNVRPGITGWAQVNGRNAVNWNKRFEMDVWYVNNFTFLVDIKILWLTLVKVIKREGISSGTSVTMEPFRGNS